MITPAPIIGFPASGFPITSITPLTYRDGITYLEKMEMLRRWVQTDLITWMNETATGLDDSWKLEVITLVDTVNAALAAQATAVNGDLADQDAENDSKITALTTFVNDAVASIINSTIAVTDPVTLAIFNNTGSATRVAMDGIYEGKVAFPTDVLATQGTATGVIYPVGSATGAVTFDTLQAALTAAETGGKKVVAAGTLTDNRTLVVTSDADLGQLTYNYTGTGIAVRIGKVTANIDRKYIIAPRVIAANKVSTGWAAVVNTVGVDFCNVQTCTITIPYISNFEVGLRGYAATFGNAYNHVIIGSLANNMINLQNFADTGGYVNQNIYYGGRFQHFSNEGTNVVGTKHIHFKHLNSVNADPNNNTFIGPSIESPTVVEYAIDMAGSLNMFFNPRMEFTGGNPKVYWRATAYRNLIFGGFNNDNIVELSDAGGFSNSIWGAQRMIFRGGGVGGGIIVKNETGDSAPDFTTLNALSTGATNPATDYMMQVRSNILAGKRAADVADRIRVNGSNGSLLLGDGTVAPVVGFSGLGASLFINDGTTLVGPITDNTADLGSLTTRRFRNASFAGAVKIGSFATASRPTAASAGQGAMIYDSDLQKPIWSTGAVWKDASGTTV